MQSVPSNVCQCMKEDFRFFNFLDQEELKVLQPYFTCAKAQSGDVLWEEGAECQFVAFILDGRVEAKKNTEFPGKQVIVGVYGKGSLVGVLCILDSSPRAVTARALEETDLLLLYKDRFDALLTEHPDIGCRLLRGMLLAVSLRLRQSFERLSSVF